MEELLASNMEKDRVLQYTSAGTHRDDLTFKLGEHPIKKWGLKVSKRVF